MRRRDRATEGDTPAADCCHATRARVLAFYLPQFHPLDLNDRFHGKGFTEWTHVQAARPLFRGHQQPICPGELGYYDLRDPAIRDQQAELARSHGVEGFIYWHYWSGGQRLLETPFSQVLESGEPEFGFCLGWANHDWRVPGRKDGPLMFTQMYGDDADVRWHFSVLEQAFHDPRYLTVDGRPIFYLFRPLDLPDLKRFCSLWQELAAGSGLPGIHFIGQGRGTWDRDSSGLLAETLNGMVPLSAFPKRSAHRRIIDRLRGGPQVANYSDLIAAFPDEIDFAQESYPAVVTGWDNTARWGRLGQVLRHPNPEAFANLLRLALAQVSDRPWQHRLVFLKSWNEWAEGNYLEPDKALGRSMLQALRRELVLRSDPQVDRP